METEREYIIKSVQYSAGSVLLPAHLKPLCPLSHPTMSLKHPYCITNHHLSLPQRKRQRIYNSISSVFIRMSSLRADSPSQSWMIQSLTVTSHDVVCTFCIATRTNKCTRRLRRCLRANPRFKSSGICGREGVNTLPSWLSFGGPQLIVGC